ncbi:MAG: MFS transporter [Mesorhizobium sp.]|nr:MFS transporter [bacterium M00.F.Ca.ET.205.01.1.1]TGU48306.1 MFS transporter [bacterium M00.F.Ca.ET.152.01.1.1]TGV32566.1 MFS transporter [Mesorhizobium sp. M00.F.Ca.ET.186.01.1.1]TGZ39823.1 MFS transporter [bacterium M00.F.Ca.ET.162.01.1.1]TIW60505.1 MAG: MFS transporter [Mesorhizobium sp.]
MTATSSSWRGLPRPALLGLFLFFCAGFADGALVPFFPLWASSEAGIPVGVIGLLFGCYAGGELLAAPLIGGIADRVGRRPVLILSSLGVGCGFIALFFVHGVAATAAVLLVTGICESVLHPTILTAIADATEPAAHPRWFSLVRVSAGAGQILGPACGALLALISLSAVFLAAGGVLILGGIVMLVALDETIGSARAAAGDRDDEQEEEGLGALLPAFRDGRLAKLLAWLVLFEVAGNWIEAVIPLYAQDAGTLTPSGVGSLFAYAAVLTVGLQMLVSRFTEARSALWLTVSAGISTIASFMLLAASPTGLALIAAVSLCSVAQMLVGPLVPTAVNALAPPARRASYMAASSVAVDLKDSLGPSIGTALYALAPRLPWIVGIPLVAIASLGLGAAIGRARRRLDTAASDAGTALEPSMAQHGSVVENYR